jgi:hypothetical protein
MGQALISLPLARLSGQLTLLLLSRQSLRLHDGRAQLHFVRVWPAEANVFGHSSALAPLGTLDRRELIGCEIGLAREQFTQISSAGVVLVQRGNTKNQVGRLERWTGCSVSCPGTRALPKGPRP